MKKVFKILGVIIGIAVLAIGGFLGYIAIRGIPKYDVNVPSIPAVVSTPERVARGEKIATLLCRNCHYDEATNKLTGRHLNEASDFGNINSKNITQDAKNGIGKWTDAQLIYFIRTGINPFTGQYVPPYMPKLMHISDEDMRSIVAYLHSDRPEVQPDKTKMPPSQPAFLTKFLSNTAFKPYPFPEKEIPNPDTTNQLEWGKYITLYQMECYACHSASFRTMNVFEPEKSEGFFGGGNEIMDPHGQKIKSLNITMDEETGIGKWTQEDFINAVKNGIVRNGPALRNPMLPFTQLTESELKAIYAYLRTVPKLKNKVDRGV